MNETTKNYCELFTANLEALKSAVKLESSYVFPVAANMLAQAGVTADPEKFKECRKLMQKKTSAFSSLTGTSELPIEVLMYLSDDPQGTYDRIKTIYEIFKKPLKGGEYGAMLAVYLYDKIDEARAEELAARGKTLYDRFNKKHPILTSPDDGVMTTFMAMSGKSDDELMKVCKEFESYFLEQVFKEMNKTIPKSEYQSQSTSNRVDYFKDNTIQKLASDSTEQNSLGLAQMLYEQMKRNYDM